MCRVFLKVVSLMVMSLMVKSDPGFGPIYLATLGGCMRRGMRCQVWTVELNLSLAMP